MQSNICNNSYVSPLQTIGLSLIPGAWLGSLQTIAAWYRVRGGLLGSDHSLRYHAHCWVTANNVSEVTSLRFSSENRSAVPCFFLVMFLLLDRFHRMIFSQNHLQPLFQAMNFTQLACLAYYRQRF